MYYLFTKKNYLKASYIYMKEEILKGLVQEKLLFKKYYKHEAYKFSIRIETEPGDGSQHSLLLGNPHSSFSILPLESPLFTIKNLVA